MRRVLYLIQSGGTDDASVAASLKGTFCPADADVRVDPATQVVAVTTTGPWRADKHGRESGLGVPGWVEVGFDGAVSDKEAPPDVDLGTLAKLAHVDATPIALDAKV